MNRPVPPLRLRYVDDPDARLRVELAKLRADGRDKLADLIESAHAHWSAR